MASQDSVKQLNEQYGFDRPLPQRLLRTTVRFVKGDFGQSVYYGRPVSAILWESLPLTLGRFFVALAIGSGAGLCTAVVSARNGWSIGSVACACLYACPSFSLMVCFLLVSSRLGLAPGGTRVVFEIAAVSLASVYALGATVIYLERKLNLGDRRTRYADFLLLMRAPRNEAVWILLRSAMPGTLAMAANSATTVLTAVTFAEFVFGLNGFAVVFIRSCERGDQGVVAAGSVVVAFLLLLLQKCGAGLSAIVDVRLRS